MLNPLSDYHVLDYRFRKLLESKIKLDHTTNLFWDLGMELDAKFELISWMVS
jgi:hypothetical protein